MTDHPNYFALPVEESWVGYLRTRLPYSFKRIEVKGKDSYSLAEPTMEEGILSAKRHNFWKRGNVFYVVGKLIDQHQLSNLWKTHRESRTNRLLDQVPSALSEFPPIFPFDSYNSIQMEKLWRFTQSNILDRERVTLTNVLQAVELCLKAVMTHSRFRGCKEFTFDAGHDVTTLYKALPDPLKDEIMMESEAFTRDYLAFREQVDADISELHRSWFQSPPFGTGARQPDRAAWERMAERIDSRSYTAFVNANDSVPYEGWFEGALERLTQEKGLGSGTYPRYAPLDEVDELPTDLVESGLLLGRFIYEHLFPVPLDDEIQRVSEK